MSKRIALGAVFVSVLVAMAIATHMGQEALKEHHYWIVVTYDSYGIPLRCMKAGGANAHVEQNLDVDHTYVSRSGYKINLGRGIAVVDIDLSHESPNPADPRESFDGELTRRISEALRPLGLDDAKCDRIQERTFDPEFDEYVGPEDDYGHGRPEDDRTPRQPTTQPPAPCNGLSCQYRDPLHDLPADADGL